MLYHSHIVRRPLFALVAILLAGVISGVASAAQTSAAQTSVAQTSDRPDEVRDLIAAHDALAMKIRPLQDRILTAQLQKEEEAGFKPDGTPLRAKARTSDAESGESRVSERLRHKNRVANSGDDYGRIKVRLSALEKKAMTERERVNRPEFGVGLRGGRDIASARKALASLRRDFKSLEKEVTALEALRKKPGRTTYDPN